MPTMVEFNRDVRPILNNKCLGCHGGVKKSGGLSFILREEALSKVKSGQFAIIPGDAKNSEMISRIKSNDPEYRMPLKENPLDPGEIDILETWIDQGAKWENHWAFEKPVEKELPNVKNEEWINNPIDRFILAKLENENLHPSKEADKRTLIRRLSLDLIGLPPSLDEINSFLKDESPDAYENLVDRLLSSKKYGERWTAMWMDLARYADSKGYEKDGHREIWKYRDWLIDSFNENMKYDEFTVQQLAGDLMANPTDENIIATAFHRNTMNNDEGGTIDEEYRMAAVIDRVNTTWDVWQGTTFSCVQCHSHPYDPIEHEEYYEFLSFFNNTEDADLPSEIPILEVYTKEEEQKLKEIDNNLKALNSEKVDDKKKRAYLELQKDSIKASNLPIMKELPLEKRRETHVFLKGNRLDLGREVESKVPDLFPQLKEGTKADRLAMAEWLTDKSNPLTSRVAVNRFWSQLFGKGIVETEEDFGSQGFMPSHPELLDWLALEFQNELEYDIKALLKLIVSSSTYRQASNVTKTMLEKDPFNVLLSRGPRIRLTAEQVRDQTLFVAGLLSDKMYGKSVMPYQPEGVWQTVYSGSKWELAQGEDAYRRAIYTYWRRTSPYPSMISFDVPSREVCVIRRISTNTPLQALVNLNDPVYLEAANSLGKWMGSQNGTLEDQISSGYEKALGKVPDDEKKQILLRLHEETRTYFLEIDANKASNSIEDSGLKDSLKEISDEKMRLKSVSLADPLAYVAHTILNLNEFLTKQ